MSEMEDGMDGMDGMMMEEDGGGSALDMHVQVLQQLVSRTAAMARVLLYSPGAVVVEVDVCAKQYGRHTTCWCYGTAHGLGASCRWCRALARFARWPGGSACTVVA